MLEPSGYRGPSLELIQKAGVRVGDRVRLILRSGVVEGLLMPRYELADAEHIVLKLPSGYNIGISVDRVVDVRRLEGEAPPRFQPPPMPEVRADLPRVLLLGTGGTIASRVDYRTGGVYPALTASEIYSLVPELASIARIDAQVLFQLYSEDMTPKHWTDIARRVQESLSGDTRGVVIAHGTDTMGYTAAALSFALGRTLKPVVLVGAQRSSDRPSSDAATNLIAAVRFACNAPVGGVFVAMHEGPSDDRIAVHQGTRVRKNHTSRRDAFQSVGVPPVATVHADGRIVVRDDWPWRRDEGAPDQPMVRFEERVALVKFYPGAQPHILEHFVEGGYRGIVIEGTGLGHVAGSWLPAIRRAVAEGVLVCMTSQCIWGNVRMTVYNKGRELMSAGVIPVKMIPETALVKLMWALGNASTDSEARELLLKPRAFEFLERDLLEVPKGYD
jgi:glutamyl-tRNA(Gln) amidotransferase subunit D